MLVCYDALEHLAPTIVDGIDPTVYEYMASAAIRFIHFVRKLFNLKLEKNIEWIDRLPWAFRFWKSCNMSLSQSKLIACSVRERECRYMRVLVVVIVAVGLKLYVGPFVLRRWDLYFPWVVISTKRLDNLYGTIVMAPMIPISTQRLYSYNMTSIAIVKMIEKQKFNKSNWFTVSNFWIVVR